MRTEFICRRVPKQEGGVMPCARAFKAIRAVIVPLMATTIAAIPATWAETIYKCRSASGAMSYSATPCRAGAIPEKQLDYVPSQPTSAVVPAGKTGTEPGNMPADAEKKTGQEAWPPKEDMHEARARAVAEEERAAAEKARQAEEFKKSYQCVYLRQRAASGDRRITLQMVESMGCM
jgi:hypothetical protein